MGECGCTTGNVVYKLKAPNGWYIFSLDPGCDYCGVGPGIRIYMEEASKLYYDDELEHIPDLPIVGSGKEAIAVIRCGLNPDEAKTAAIKYFTGTPMVCNDALDKIDAEYLGEDFWQEALSGAPSAVLPHKEKA